MPDGLQNVYYPADPAVELWQFATDSPGVIECDALAAYTRGLPFTYEDFTPEQLHDLLAPVRASIDTALLALAPGPVVGFETNTGRRFELSLPKGLPSRGPEETEGSYGYAYASSATPALYGLWDIDAEEGKEVAVL